MAFLDNLNWRYAAKNFTGEEVSKENLDKILHAIKMSPSSFGVQPYHVVVVSNKDKLQALKQAAKDNEKKFDTASHILIFCTRTDIYSRFRELEKLQNRVPGSMKKFGLFYQYFTEMFGYHFLGQIFTSFSWTTRQTYIALGFALAACAELQVDSCPMEGFDSLKFKSILNLDNNTVPVVLLALGTRDKNDNALKFHKTRFAESDLFTFL